MGREIKFRAWDPNRKVMEHCISINPFNVTDCDRFLWKWEEVEVMQYTGLSDKNGREIYEGDVLEFADMGEEGYEYREGYDFTNRAIVVFEEGRYTLNKFADYNSAVVEELNLHDETVSTMKFSLVIGNIYENPELINPAPIQTDTQAVEVR